MSKVLVDREDFAHELWSAAQLAPGEGISDGVARIAALLAQPAEAEGVERWSKLKELAEKATPGPWVSFCRPSVQAVFGPNGVQANSEGTIVNWPGFDSSDTTKAKRKANAKFIAAANPAAVLELIAALSAVTAQRDRLLQYERICAGLPQVAIDGGWTAAGLSAHAKAVEQERDQLRAKVDQLTRESEGIAERAKHYAGQLGKALGEMETLRKDAELYRRLRDLPDDQVGTAGVPCVAVPRGPFSGTYVSGAELDAAMAAKEV